MNWEPCARQCGGNALKAERLQRLSREWQAAVKRWQIEFDSAAEKTLTGVTDTRTRIAVLSHAMALMHAK
jgi:hypothetical protein